MGPDDLTEWPQCLENLLRDGSDFLWMCEERDFFKWRGFFER